MKLFIPSVVVALLASCGGSSSDKRVAGDPDAKLANIDGGAQDASQRDAPLQDGAPRDASLTDAPPAGCGSNHTKVGWIADLSTLYHGVKGRVTVLDNCTLQVTNFFYDGKGIDVKFYGAANVGAFTTGFPIGPQLVRSNQPWVNESLRLDLPAGKSLDDLNAISVWCIDVSLSFGHGAF